MLVEVVLYLFISNVDTQLLKRVGREILKAENVQQANDAQVLTAKKLEENV